MRRKKKEPTEQEMRELSRRNNLVRAERALQGVVAHVRYCHDGENYDDAGALAEGVQDLISDLMHLCDVKGIDFDAVVRAAHGNHDGEKKFDQDEEAFCFSGGLERQPAEVELPELQ